MVGGEKKKQKKKRKENNSLTSDFLITNAAHVWSFSYLGLPFPSVSLARRCQLTPRRARRPFHTLIGLTVEQHGSGRRAHVRHQSSPGVNVGKRTDGDDIMPHYLKALPGQCKHQLDESMRVFPAITHLFVYRLWLHPTRTILEPRKVAAVRGLCWEML